jgi:hypothetical protein
MTDKSTISTPTSAINQFLNQVKTLQNNESVVDLIIQIIESPNIHSFSEFLETQAIIEVKTKLILYKNQPFVQSLLF